MLPSGKLYTSNLNGLKKINFAAKKLMITRAEMDIADVIMRPSLGAVAGFIPVFAGRPKGRC